MSRGIKKGSIPDKHGGMRNLTEADVLDLSPTNSVMEHRFSIGGDLGEKAQYFVIGGKEAAKKGILMELAVGDPAKIIFNETKLNGIKVLDTTQPEVAQLLMKNGISNEALVGSTKLNYNLTQSLGNAARSLGFEGLIVQPRPPGGYKNLVIFK